MGAQQVCQRTLEIALAGPFALVSLVLAQCTLDARVLWEIPRLKLPFYGETYEQAVIYMQNQCETCFASTFLHISWLNGFVTLRISRKLRTMY